MRRPRLLLLTLLSCCVLLMLSLEMTRLSDPPVLHTHHTLEVFQKLPTTVATAPAPATISSSSSSNLRDTGTEADHRGSSRQYPVAIQAGPCAQQVQKHVQAVVDQCPGLPGYCPRPPSVQGIDASDYLTSTGPLHAGMAQYKAAVDRFVAGDGLQDRLQQLQQLPDKRGILISAGKSHHVGGAIVILHALRRQHNCTLPVEIAYRGDKEFDAVTRATLEEAFQPLFWLDLNQQRYPTHHHKAQMDRYEPKIYALYHSRFQQVLMLDADNLPLRDPTYLFDAPHHVLHGAMFWLDLWSPELSSTTFIGQPSVYPLLGIVRDKYWEVLSAGQGWMQRAAESGQVVFDRVKHADVLEYLWWLTSFSSVLYKHVLGDKDTFAFAFAMAGKLHNMYAVGVPPGAAFRHEGDHWRFHAMLQYDHLGQPVFFHRTFEKWNDVLKPPHMMDIITGPLPNRFIVSYLGNKSVALSPNVPNHALHPVSINCPAPLNKFVAGGSTTTRYVSAPTEDMVGSCPLTLYLEYQQLQNLGLPVARLPLLEAVCAPLQQQLRASQEASKQGTTSTTTTTITTSNTDSSSPYSRPASQSAAGETTTRGSTLTPQHAQVRLHGRHLQQQQHHRQQQQEQEQQGKQLLFVGTRHGLLGSSATSTQRGAVAEVPGWTLTAGGGGGSGEQSAPASTLRQQQQQQQQVRHQQEHLASPQRDQQGAMLQGQQAAASWPHQRLLLQADLHTGITAAVLQAPQASSLPGSLAARQEQEQANCVAQGDASSSLWGHLHDASMWLQACHVQRSGNASHLPTAAAAVGQQEAAAAADGDDMLAAADTVAAAAAAAATGGGPGHAVLSMSHVGLPPCDRVSWHMARYVLHEYAEAVARDSSSGEIVRDTDPQLQALQLVGPGRSSSRSSQEAGGSGDAGGSHTSGWCRGLLSEGVSPLDVMQHVTIPAARAWVQQHVSRLPALKNTKASP